MKLIDKDALVAEIEKRIFEYENCGTDNATINAKIIALQSLLIYIDTLEIKEVENPNNAFIEKVDKFFEDYFTEENCKFGISEWTEVKSGFESLDSLKRAFKNYMEG